MTVHQFLALDLGAESGRAILGSLDGKHLQLREINRFPNGTVEIAGHLHWDLLSLYEKILKSLRICADEITASPASIAFDTWGVDFTLISSDGAFLGKPFAYRDKRTEGAMEQFFEKVPRQRLYELTGIQMLPFNTLFQLFSMVRDRSPQFDSAAGLLFIPDALNFAFTGRQKTEFSFATTSQLFNPRTGSWEREIFDALGIDIGLMQEVVEPGSVLGNLQFAVAQITGMDEVPVVTTASHDTAAAVAAVPAEGEDWAYISSGTWSLVGVETTAPIIDRQALEHNFTNEGGVGGTFRFLKNVMGMWLLQECRRAWSNIQAYSYENLTSLAEEAAPSTSLIDPDWQGFLNPDNMPAAIAEYCRETSQPVPDSPARCCRAIFDSLALKYKMVIEQAGQLCGRQIRRIHIVGGGSRNRLLCQLTADATGLPVYAGPAEATAVGNILVQALALGFLSGLAGIREIVRESFVPVVYKPRRHARWSKAHARFREICAHTGG